MKTIYVIIAALILTGSLFAANEKVVKSKVKSVTIFMNGAQVSRTGSFTADRGVSDIIFEGVSPYLNNNSIQAGGTGDYIILDVKFRVKQPDPIPPQNFPLPPQIVKDISLLKDSLAQINFDIENVINKKDVLNLEKNVLLGNQFMQGKVDTIPELQQAMEYLRKQLNDINNALNTIKREEYKLTKIQERMTKRLNDLSSYNAQVNPPVIEGPKYQIVVTISAKEAVSGTLNVNYMVSNAGWTPAYDIRANGVGQPIQLVYKANVYQTSGEEWDNVKLKLSTITPNQSIYKPSLPILYLGFYVPYSTVSYDRERSKKDMSGYGALATSAPTEDYYVSEMPATSSAQYAQVNQTMTNVEYEIDLPYNIPSDGLPHMVAVQDKELKAEYFHYLVPRLDKEAYLIARVTEWSTLDLLPASANIYFEGTYVGETSINTGIMSDTLELALGKDRGVIIERKKLTDENRNELIGSNVVKTVSYELKIKNNKIAISNLIIEDQIPMASTGEIKIQKLEVAGAEFNETTGLLTWRAKVGSKQVKTINFSYSIEYDKNKQLANIF